MLTVHDYPNGVFIKSIDSFSLSLTSHDGANVAYITQQFNRSETTSMTLTKMINRFSSIFF